VPDKPAYQTIVILGAASALAIAYARIRARTGRPRFILAGRDTGRLSVVSNDLIARGAAGDSAVVVGDLGHPDAVAGVLDEIKARAGSIDEVFVSYGVLGEQEALQKSISEVRNILNVDFVSAAMWAEAFAEIFEKQGRGRLVLIGSVAGDRGRRSNYLYGAAKGGLERVAEGMAHRFAQQKDICVTLVKPGFIDTPMTDHMDKGGPLWASPETVARAIVRAVDKKRTRIYAPWIWRYIMLIVRALPAPVIHRTKL
jgi:short-subunit dehydrogenase